MFGCSLRVVRYGVLSLTLLLCASVTASAQDADSREESRHERPVVQPGAPGDSIRLLDGTSSAPPSPGYSEADFRFMRDMMVHHGQALEMTDLVPDRTSSDAVRMLARRIEISQRDEIEFMRTWLVGRGERPSPPASSDSDNPHSHHVHGQHGQAQGHHDHSGMMPGMLSPEQLDELAAADGEEFDLLFLEYMIHHHEGALVMVEALFDSEGGGQETDIFQFASHVDSDQRIEIQRMRRMLASLTHSGTN